MNTLIVPAYDKWGFIFFPSKQSSNQISVSMCELVFMVSYQLWPSSFFPPSFRFCFLRFVLFFSLSFFGCHFLTKCLLVWPVLNCSKQKKKQMKKTSHGYFCHSCVWFFFSFFSVLFLSSSFVFVLGRSNLRCIQNFSVPFDDAILMVVARTLTVKMMLTLILTMTTTMTIVLTIQ